MRTWLLAGIAVLLFAAAAPAQTAGWQFRWKAGQVLTYRVQHVMSAVETARDTKDETTQKLDLVKRWQVLAVDPAGVATVQKSLVSLRIEKKLASDVLLFDSANLDRSNPQMREQLSKYIGKPLEVLRVDSKGKVVEVKDSKYGPASRFESELPFVLTLPNEAPSVGQSWERAYTITLEPPEGVGEKHSAAQKYACKALDKGMATVTFTTRLVSQPEAAADRIPLLPSLPAGEVVFDLQAGRLQKATLKIDQELKDYQGEGTTYHFTSTYSEEFAGNQ
jgi:hypothetical protein